MAYTKVAFERCSLEERTKILMEACGDAEIGWLVDFTSSAITDHFPRQGRQPEPPDKCLVTKDVLDHLKEIALGKIIEAAQDGSLVNHFDLPSILFRWREFANDESKAVKEWTSKALKDDVNTAKIACAFTSITTTMGLGLVGLPDRISRRTPRAQVEGVGTIFDVEFFKKRLNEVFSSAVISGEQREDVRVFLKAWEEQEKGED